jgi:RecA-family ATPase
VILPPKQVSILAGASGSGKTTLILQALLAHERGDKFPIQFPKDVKSFGVVIADRTKDEAQVHVNKLGLTCAEVYGIADDASLPTSLVHKSETLLSEVIKRFKHSHQVIILDPIMLFMEGSSIDYKQVAASLIRLSRYCIHQNLAILATHHAAKSRSDFTFMRPQDRISGSAAFQGFSGTQMVLIEGLEGGSDFDRFIAIPHLTPKEEYKLTRGKDGYFVIQRSPYDLLHEFLKSCHLIKEKDFFNQAAIAGLDAEEALKELTASKMLTPIGGGFLRRTSGG